MATDDRLSHTGKLVERAGHHVPEPDRGQYERRRFAHDRLDTQLQRIETL